MLSKIGRRGGGAIAAGVLIAATLGSPNTAEADIVRLTQGLDGYSGVSDATIYGDGGDVANGGGDYLFIGVNSQDNVRRSLVRFDLTSSGIPDGSIITGASLNMVISQTNSTSQRVTVHRLTRPWSEGTSDPSGSEGQGIAAEAGDVTLTHNLYPSSTWNTPGGDFVSSPSAVTNAGGSLLVTWTSAQMIAEVQAWLNNPNQNFGWMVRGDETLLGEAVRLVSSNNDTDAVVTDRPTLVVQYEIPAPAGMLALMMGGGLLTCRRRSRNL